MEFCSALDIPDSCKIDKTVFKKLFYENANLSKTDKDLFIDVIDKITWRYCLKPETINVRPYKDDEREYPEIEVMEVFLTEERGLKRIAEIVMRAIPYPMLLIICLEDKFQAWAAHQRFSLADSDKTTMDVLEHSSWQSTESALLDALKLKKLRFTNFFEMYSDIVDAISVFNAQEISQVPTQLTGEKARIYTKQIEDLDRQITTLRAALKKENQFNRKIEANLKIKALEKDKKSILEGRQ